MQLQDLGLQLVKKGLQQKFFLESLQNLSIHLFCTAALNDFY